MPHPDNEAARNSAPRDGEASERFVTFDCAGDTCVGILSADTRSASGTGTGVVIVVGGPQYRAGSHRQFVLMARALARAGFPVLRFDYRGMGDSDGAARSFEAVDEDIAAAITALRRETGMRQTVLFGLCDGASAALMYAPGDPRVAGVVALNPWARSPQVESAIRLRHYYARRLLSWPFWRKALRGRFALRRGAGEFAGAIRGALAGEAGMHDGSFLRRMHDGWSHYRGPVLCVLS